MAKVMSMEMGLWIPKAKTLKIIFTSWICYSMLLCVKRALCTMFDFVNPSLTYSLLSFLICSSYSKVKGPANNWTYYSNCNKDNYCPFPHQKWEQYDHNQILCMHQIVTSVSLRCRVLKTCGINCDLQGHYFSCS